MGCTYSKIHSRKKDCPLVKERMQGQCREAVADGGGVGKQSCALPLALPHPVIPVPTCLFSHVPTARSQLNCATTNSTSLCSELCHGYQGMP